MKKLLNNKIFKISFLILSIILLIIALIIVLNKNEYKKIEKMMVKNAKEYIARKNIDVTNQEYVFIEDLNITSGAELCSKASGVVVTNIGGSIKYYPYLKCIDYESKVLKNSKSYIELIGSDVALVNLGTLYFDKGYKKIKDDIEVETVGVVPDEVGAYTINYVVTKNGKQKTIVKRIVVVSDYDTEISINGLDDKEKPVIILKDEEEMILKLNSQFEEPGYIAYDYTDGKITRKVAVSPKKIDTGKEGIYSITYKVTNSKGKTYSAERKVKVVKEMCDFDITTSTAENGSAINESKIEIMVIGDGFEKLVLPDGSVSEYNIAEYAATSNGTYTFKIVDKFQNYINKSVVIDNIDSKPPTGTCSAEVKNGETLIKVVAEDDRGVMSVDYILNGNETGFLSTTGYKTRENISVVEAVIKDVAGNTKRISCPFN